MYGNAGRDGRGDKDGGMTGISRVPLLNEGLMKASGAGTGAGSREQGVDGRLALSPHHSPSFVVALYGMATPWRHRHRHRHHICDLWRSTNLSTIQYQRHGIAKHAYYPTV